MKAGVGAVVMMAGRVFCWVDKRCVTAVVTDINSQKRALNGKKDRLV